MTATPCIVEFTPFQSFVNITTESSLMCSYINYHIAMFLFFGSISITLSIITLLLWICHQCCNQSQIQAFYIRYCATWALTSALLSTGIEGPILLFYVCIVMVTTHMVITYCIHETHLFRTTRVAPGEDIIITVSTAGEENPKCSICLDTVAGTLVKTQCTHVFHRECLQRWKNNTCPLCRQRMIIQ